MLFIFLYIILQSGYFPYLASTTTRAAAKADTTSDYAPGVICNPPNCAYSDSAGTYYYGPEFPHYHSENLHTGQNGVWVPTS
ncbi:hypothetical protein GCM10010913_12980 [Paenibacillus aceti]|uniref:YHYH domain-containing protein n=1 Tax=Paenibacillus aceti TaxID=1820010 RepID=A0ABQ1VTM8_9BACL|nr:hypothetical protein GCM10010913_12980 [Paenibacillus aceti]